MILKGISKSIKFFIVDISEILKKFLEKDENNIMYANEISKMISMATILSQGIKNEKTRISLNLLNEGIIENIIVKTSYDNKIALKIKKNEEKEQKLYKMIQNDELDNVKSYLKLKNASLEITIDYGLKLPYISKFDVRDSLLELTMNDYLNKSEQTKSIMLTSIEYSKNGTVEKASALLFQNLPNADEKTLEFLTLKLERITSISKMLKNGFSLEKIAYLLFEDDIKIFENESIYKGLPFEKMPLIEEIKILDKKEIQYGCDCNREYMKKAIKLSLSNDEISKFIEEDGKLEIICNFCNEKYIFNNDKELIDEF